MALVLDGYSFWIVLHTRPEHHARDSGSRLSHRRRTIMLYWALMFLVIALVAAVLGFGGIAGTSAWIAQVLFVVFLVLFLVSLLTGSIRRPIP
jgi:uncharacterized membrane protein YtjA (UPF0391 family)